MASSTRVPFSPRSFWRAPLEVIPSVEVPSISLMMSPERTPSRSAGPPFMGLMMAMPWSCCWMMAPMPKKEPFCSSRMRRNSLSSM